MATAHLPASRRRFQSSALPAVAFACGAVLTLMHLGCANLPGEPDGAGATSATGGVATGGFGATATGGVAATGGVSGSGGATGGTGVGATGGTLGGTGGSPSGGAFGTGGISTGGQSTGGGGDAAGGASGGGGTGGVGASGGGDGSGGGTGGTVSAGFQPCPETGPCKVLPLGDSITFGLGFAGGYRVELFHLALQDGHEITFTGTQQKNGPAMVDGVPFPSNHEGISGQTIQQIADRVPSPALNEMPHIVLLHAGTNDMYQTPSGADTRLGALIDELVADAPDALIVVSNIIPFPQGSGPTATFNATVPGVVEQRASAGAHVVFVDQFKDFPTSELGDGVHPNQAGYARMAGVWYDAILEYLR